MIQKPSYTIAVVGPSAYFAKPIENNLQELIPNYDVIGYDSPIRFLNAIEQYPLQVPLLVIADVWAREPKIEEGVFNKAHIKVPRIRGIYFSSQPLLDDCRQMLHLDLLAGVVTKGSEGDMKQLGHLVRRVIKSFESSTDYRLINRLAEEMRQIPKPKNYLVDTGRDTLNLPQVLIELARKTPTGELILYNLLSAGLLETTGVRTTPDTEISLDPWWTRLLPLLRLISRPLCSVSIVGGILIFVVSCILRYFDMAVLGVGALVIGLVHLTEKD